MRGRRAELFAKSAVRSSKYTEEFNRRDADEKLLTCCRCASLSRPLRGLCGLPGVTGLTERLYQVDIGLVASPGWWAGRGGLRRGTEASGPSNVAVEWFWASPSHGSALGSASSAACFGEYGGERPRAAAKGRERKRQSKRAPGRRACSKGLRRGQPASARRVRQV
jgi:hypothetical protein